MEEESLEEGFKKHFEEQDNGRKERLLKRRGEILSKLTPEEVQELKRIDSQLAELSEAAV